MYFEVAFISPPPTLHLGIWFSTEHICLFSGEPVIIEPIVVARKNPLHLYEDALENKSLGR